MAEEPRKPLPSRRPAEPVRAPQQSRADRHDWQPEDVEILEEGAQQPEK